MTVLGTTYRLFNDDRSGGGSGRCGNKINILRVRRRRLGSLHFEIRRNIIYFDVPKFKIVLHNRYPRVSEIFEMLTTTRQVIYLQVALPAGKHYPKVDTFDTHR